MTTGAVIAHFDPKGERSSNWQAILAAIRPFVLNGVVVSTGITSDDVEVARSLGYAVVRRRNIGYDFLSYAIGFDVMKGAHRVSRVLFSNDSFFIANSKRFSATILDLVESSEKVKFATISSQIDRHGQSYLFAVDATVFNRSAFSSFFRSIRPETSRYNVILRDGLGFSHCLRSMRTPIVGIIEGKARRHFGDRRGLNPTHDLAERVESELGYVKYELLLRNPLSLRSGRWINEVSARATEPPLQVQVATDPTQPKCVVICHCHYLEVVDEMIEFLERFPDGTEIQITSSDLEVLATFKTRWCRRNLSLGVLATENRGRDVLPFFKILSMLNVADNTPILKVHGKRSLYSPLGNKWRKDIFSSLGASETSIMNIIGEFATDPELGILGPAGSYVSSPDYWGANDERVFAIMADARVPSTDRDDLGFFAGNMFWIRSQCLRTIAETIDEHIFEEEGGQQDGTYAHAIERAIPMVVARQGWHLREVANPQILTPDIVRHRRLEYF